MQNSTEYVSSRDLLFLFDRVTDIDGRRTVLGIGKLVATAVLFFSLIGGLAACASVTEKETESKVSILTDNKLTVAMECAYAPYNWSQENSRDGASPIRDSQEFAHGYDVLIAQKLAKELNMELEIVRSDWDSLVPAVQSGVVDCAIAGQSITSERLQNVDFTRPYFYATIAVLTRRDSAFARAKSVADLNGAKVTSQLNTIWYDKCLPQIPNAEILPGQDSAPAMIVALESGSCDAVVTDFPTAQMAVAAHPDLLQLHFGGGATDFKVSEEDINIGISLQKGNVILREKLDAILRGFSEEEMQTLMSRAVSLSQNQVESASFSDGEITAASASGEQTSSLEVAETVSPAQTQQTYFSWIEKILSLYGLAILAGAGKTLLIALISTFFGCLIGFFVGFWQTIPCQKKDGYAKYLALRLSKALFTAYVEIFRGTPMMVQAAFIYYGMAMLFNVHMNMWTAAIFIVSINTGAYMAETVRGGILSIDRGQVEGAIAIGMNHWQTMRYVVGPQALRNIMPQIGNNLIINIKDTCVLAIIGVTDLFYTVKGISGTTYAFFPAYSIAMIVYFVLTLGCSKILRIWEKKMAGAENYELMMADPLVLGEGMHRFQGKGRETNRDYLVKMEEEKREAAEDGSYEL